MRQCTEVSTGKNALILGHFVCFMPVFSVSPQLLSHFSNPFAQVGFFMVASGLMIWRLQAIESKGFEGTVLGTLIMPYCSGFANLVFAYVMSRQGGKGTAVIENCLVNNVTNLTLILGLATVFFGGKTVNKAKASKGARAKAASKVQPQTQRITQLEMLFTLVALFLFTGTLWALAKDGVLDFYDGLVLVGLFLFWQVLHVFEILKNNVRKSRSFEWTILIDLVLIGVAAYGVYFSVTYLVDWLGTVKSPYIGAKDLGWLSGMLMVVPNTFIALYYGWVGRQDIVVSSQVGDGHICIPMCIGLFALFDPIRIPSFFQIGIYVITAAAMLHFLFIAALGRLPRVLGWVLIAGYGVFMAAGVVQG